MLTGSYGCVLFRNWIGHRECSIIIRLTVASQMEPRVNSQEIVSQREFISGISVAKRRVFSSLYITRDGHLCLCVGVCVDRSVICIEYEMANFFSFILCNSSYSEWNHHHACIFKFSALFNLAMYCDCQSSCRI